MRLLQHNFLLILFLVGITMSSCSKKIRPERPDSQNIRSTIERNLSSINVPIELQIVELERQVNEEFNGLIYEDKSYDNNDEDNLKLKVRKIDLITISASGDEVYYNVPVNIWASYRASVLGVHVTKSTSFQAVLKFKTKIDITSKWNLKTQTESLGYSWLKKPVLDFSLFEIQITGVVGDILDEELPEIAEIMDDEIKKGFDARQTMWETWLEIQKPILMSEDYKAWLKIEPKKITMSGIDGNSRRITFNIGMDAYIDISIGEEPTYKMQTELPDLIKTTERREKEFHVDVISEISYAQATEIMKKDVVGYIYEYKKKRIEVVDAEAFNVGDELGIRLDLKGSLDGSVYLKGIPTYDSTSQMISISNFDFDIKTKKLALKVANWLLHGTFKRKIQDYCKLSIKETIEEYSTVAEESMQENPFAENLKLDLKIKNVEPKGIYLSEEGILTYITLDGKARVIYGK